MKLITKIILFYAFVSVVVADDFKIEDCPYKPNEMFYFKCVQQVDITKFNNLKLSAESGDTEAQYKLASYYIDGRGTSRNYTEAFKWAKKSAEGGNEFAQQYIYAMYFQGKGTDKDLVESYAWASILADTGELRAGSFLETLTNEMWWFQLSWAKDRAKEIKSQLGTP